MNKAKNKITGQIIDIINISKSKIYPRIFQDVTGKTILESDLEILGENQAISGMYIARDESGDLFLHFFKPTREFDDNLKFSGNWGSSVGMKFILPSGLFPDLKWEDNPKEVYLDIILRSDSLI